MIFDTDTTSTDNISEAFSDPNEVLEALIVDQITHLPEEKINEFCAPGGVGEQLVQEGKFKNRTLVRLSKNDDLKRRQKIIAIKCAKEHNDPLYKKWVKIHAQEKELLLKMYNKYNNASMKMAKQSQKEYLHPASSKKVLPASFLKNGIGRTDDDD